MFFDEENLAVEILDVLEFRHNNVHNVGCRPFHALSYRITADADISTPTQSFHAGNGALMYFPANCPYRRASVEEHSIVIHFALYNRDFHEIELYMPSNRLKIESLFSEILAVNREPHGSGLEKSRLFFAILEELRRERQNRSLERGVLLDMEAYIAQHLAEPSLTIASLAARMYMSEVTFRKFFFAQFSVSPKKYILEKRFSRAISLLNTREYSIADVAHLSGFPNEKNFSTLFKKRYGVPPSRFHR